MSVYRQHHVLNNNHFFPLYYILLLKIIIIVIYIERWRGTQNELKQRIMLSTYWSPLVGNEIVMSWYTRHSQRELRYYFPIRFLVVCCVIRQKRCSSLAAATGGGAGRLNRRNPPTDSWQQDGETLLLSINNWSSWLIRKKKLSSQCLSVRLSPCNIMTTAKQIFKKSDVEVHYYF
jgi:hypothetical protein